MAVSLTISETIAGAALSDALSGGGTGLDLGSVTNNSYAPIVLKSANTGRQDLYIRHNAVTNEITNVKFHIGQYGLLTGYSYGGQRTAADDYTAIKNLGYASGSSKNNADGNSGGLWLEMDAFVSDANRFDAGRGGFTGQVKIFGDGVGSPTDGIDLASAFSLHIDACVYNNAGTETDATTPVTGKIGKSGDTVLGDRGHIQLRIYLPNSHAEGGIYQVELITSYSYTA